MITLTFRSESTYNGETLSREVQIDLDGDGIGEHIEAFIDALRAFTFPESLIKQALAEFAESAQ